MANSSAATKGEFWNKTRHDALRDDILSTTTGHVHDGTNGRGDAEMIFNVAGRVFAFENTTDAVSNQIGIFRGDNATRGDNDEIYLSWYMDDDAGSSVEVVRQSAVFLDVSAGSKNSRPEWNYYTANILRQLHAPPITADDEIVVLALAQTLSNKTFADPVFTGDLSLASGSKIDWDSGDVTITHAAGKITLGGDGTVEFDFANHEMTNVDINSGAIDGTAIGAASATTIVGTTIDATTDFTIGATVIEDGVITDAGGLQIDAELDITGSLVNVAGAGSTWTSTMLHMSAAVSGGNSILRLSNTSSDAGSDGRLLIYIAATTAGDPYIEFQIQSGETVKNGLDNSDSDLLVWSDGSIGTNNRMTMVVATGVLSVDGDGGGADDPVALFDHLDDAMELQRYAHATLDVPDAIVSPQQRRANRERLVEMGIASWAEQDDGGPDHLLIAMQPMTKLLAGGVYQNRVRMDAQYQDLDRRLRSLGV